MTDTPGTLVASRTSLSHNPIGKYPQPSERDVAAPSEIEIDKLSLENFILKSMVEGLIFFIINGDCIKLAMRRAEDTCTKAGLDPKEFMPIVKSVINNFQNTTRKNPMHSMF